jgi:hypothetical protein
MSWKQEIECDFVKLAFLIGLTVAGRQTQLVRHLHAIHDGQCHQLAAPQLRRIAD